MSKIRDRIFSLFEKSQSVIVFPTEDTARYFLMAYAKAMQRPVRADRAISYDTFRSIFLPNREEKPANSYVRAVYAATHIDEKMGLKYLIRTGYPESFARMRPFIEKCLPELKDRNKCKKEVREDLDILYADYTSFLKEHGFFEPGLETLQHVTLDKEYVLLFPELNAGSDELVEHLEGEKRVKIIHVSDLDKECDDKPLFEYDNPRQEIRAMMRKLLGLRREGVALDDIVLSTPDLDSLRPLLSSQAKLYGIPLSFVPGIPVLETVPGSLFLRLQSVYQSEYSFSSLEDLLLFPGYPWRDMEKNRAFILKLAEKNARGGSHVYKEDTIIRSLSRYNVNDEETPVQLEFYKELRADIKGLFDAESAIDVKNRIQAFMTTFFTEEQFKDGGERENEYAFLLSELIGFAASEENLGCKSGSAFNLFVTTLKNKKYVSQSKAEGIRVYRFGQDVLIDSKYHFLFGLDENQTATVGSRSVFFEPYEVEIVEKEKEVSDEYFTLYQMGSANVSFSYSSATYSGAVLPSRYFVKHDLVKKDEKLPDAYSDAIEVAIGKETGASSLPLLKKGWDYATLSGLSSGKRVDLTFRNESDRKAAPEKGFSFTSIDMYTKCPFSFYLKYALTLRDESFIPLLLDHALVGTKLHAVAEEFFNAHKGEFLQPSKVNEYKAELDKDFDKVLSAWQRESKAPDNYTLIWMNTYRNSFATLIDELASRLDPVSPAGIEVKVRCTIDDEVFFGLVDAILEKENGEQVLIDFKKGDAKTKADTIQLPLYKMLLAAENSETRIAELSYYSFQNEKFEEVKNADELELVAKDRIQNMFLGLKKGDWHAKPDEDNCKNCNFKAICRRRFTII